MIFPIVMEDVFCLSGAARLSDWMNVRTTDNQNERKHLYMFVYQPAVEGFLSLKVNVHSTVRLL